MSPDDWLGFVCREYLDDFVKDGGASIKFAVPRDREAATDVLDGVIRAAEERGYLTATLDAGRTRIHMMDQFFFRIAEQIPWRDLALAVLTNLAQGDGYRVPDLKGGGFEDAVASANDLDPLFVRDQLRRMVSKAVARRRSLAKDFRVAMTWLCLAELSRGDEGATTTAAILDWLTGRARTVGAVRPYNIFTRIHRTNARFALESTLDWIRFAGWPGLVVSLDLARVTLARNPRDGLVFYARPSRFDAYELLRQCIDATDRLRGFLLVVVPELEFLDETPGGKGIGGYQALMFRVYDEVRDTQVVNPMSTLVRVASTQRRTVEL